MYTVEPLDNNRATEGQDWLLRGFFIKADKKHMEKQFSNERLCELIQQGHEEYYFQLWSQCEKFIRMKAEQYVRQFDSGQDLAEDCVQEAYLAFQGIVSRYDPKLGVKFLSFLKPSLHSAFRSVMFSGRGKTEKDPLNNCDSLDRPIFSDDGSEMSMEEVIGDEHSEDGFREIEMDDYRRSQNEFIRECIGLSSDAIGKRILAEMLESNCGYRDAIYKLYGEDALNNEELVTALRRRKDYAVTQIRHKSKHGVKEKLMRKYGIEKQADRGGLRGYGRKAFVDRGYVSEIESIVLSGMEKKK